MNILLLRRSIAVLTASLLAGCASSASSDPQGGTAPAGSGPVIVQPGAPGEGTRTLSSDDLATSIDELPYTQADVEFMQGMIPHHAQALIMTDLARDKATTDAVRQMALRMEISQRDEIALMEGWLRDHDEPVEMSMGGMSDMGGMDDMGGMAGMHGGHMMPGMLTPEQMQDLRDATGVTFDRLFLEYMIQHHQGAITMVQELFASSGAAQETTVFKFAEDVDADQTMEIDRMQRILDGLR